MSNFIVQNELNKLKINIPLLKIIKVPSYKQEINNFLNNTTTPANDLEFADIINIQDDTLNITIGPFLGKDGI